jgi:putative DNA primase/helicase
MNDAGDKFDPLSDEERKAQVPPGGKDKPASQIVLPVPADAPPPPETHPSLGRPSGIYRYPNIDGETLHYVYVFPPRRLGGRKTVLPLTYRTRDGACFWDWKGYPSDHSLPLYRLDQLAAHPDADVLILEGEKCAEAGTKLFEGDRSIVATSTMGGAEADHRADLESVRGRAAIVWQDNDEVGAKFAKRLADRLIEMDCAVSIVDVGKIIEKYGQGLNPAGLDVADLPLSADLAADVRAFAVPYAGDPLKGLDKADAAAIDAFIEMMKANPNKTWDISVLMSLAGMSDVDFIVLLDRLADAGVPKSAITALKSKVKAARKKRSEKPPPIDPDDMDPAKMLLIDTANPHRTAAAIHEFVLKGGEVFHSVVEDRTVRLSKESDNSATVTIGLNSDGLKIVIHNFCRPYEFARMQGGFVVRRDCEIPDGIVRSYMNYYGAKGLKSLRGISAAPKLSENGSIDCSRGYDEPLGVFFEGVAGVLDRIPTNPTEQEARDALQRIRKAFRTLPFSDAVSLKEGATSVVDINQPARLDESVFLTQLIGAAIRASIKHCPGLIVKGARNSGSGSGKGLAVRCVIVVALRALPFSFARNESTEGEIDKTIVAALRGGPAFLFLDNFNDIQISSAVLESMLTEDSRARILGRSDAANLGAAIFVAITGNGVGVKGDAARRFVECFFDAGVENPSAREFERDLQSDVTYDRDAILAGILTIWRWGRQNKNLKPGVPVGTFEQWSRWARDPLVALGCMDAAITMKRSMESDPGREGEISVFRAWWGHHKDARVPGSDLHDEVLAEIHAKATRKNVAWYLRPKIGERIGGFILHRGPGEYAHSPAVYWLELTGPAPPEPKWSPPPKSKTEVWGFE